MRALKPYQGGGEQSNRGRTSTSLTSVASTAAASVDNVDDDDVNANNSICHKCILSSFQYDRCINSDIQRFLFLSIADNNTIANLKWCVREYVM